MSNQQREASQNKPGSAFYLDQSSLACKAGCGFFGNPEWFGYCSICYKQLTNNQRLAQSANESSSTISSLSQHFLWQPLISAGQRSQQSQPQHQHQIHYQPQQPMSPQNFYTAMQQQQQQQQQQQYQQQQQLQYQHHPQHYYNQSRAQDYYPQQEHSLSMPSQTPMPAVTPEREFGEMNLSESGDGTQHEQQTRSRPHPPQLSVDTSRSNSISSNSGSLTPLAKITSSASNMLKQYMYNPIMTAAATAASAASPKETMSTKDTISKDSSSSKQPHFLYEVAWMDCLRCTTKFSKELLAAERLPDKTINDLSDMVHNFYQTMNDKFENQFIYKSASPDQVDLLNDNMERILNEHIYQVISARIVNEDEEHNMAIQKRIRSLNWITAEHLEIDIDFQRPAVHDLLDKAICQMIEMNSRTSTIDKLDCIYECSKTIFELLQISRTEHSKPKATKDNQGSDLDKDESIDDEVAKEARDDNPQKTSSEDRSSFSSRPVSADQFLPVLVFVVIQANPPMLPADMKYLTRFSNPRRLMSGETGYYFTNLCCALEFIEKASGASFNISEEEFKKYVNGEAVPETNSQFDTYLSNGLRTMCSNQAALSDLSNRSEMRQSKIESLFEQIDVHLETNRAKLKEMQTFAANLKLKLRPNLPKFYHELCEQNKSFAAKLLPSYLRRANYEDATSLATVEADSSLLCPK